MGPKLEGKIHIYVGEADNYFLNNAVYLVDDFLKAARNPYYGGEVDYEPRAEHCWCGDHTPKCDLQTPLPSTPRAEDRRANPEERATRRGFEELAVLEVAEKDVGESWISAFSVRAVWEAQAYMIGLPSDCCSSPL